MTFDVEEILRSKQAFRQRLTVLPIAEKLRLLDELRKRAVAINGTKSTPVNIREEPPHYGRGPR